MSEESSISPRNEKIIIKLQKENENLTEINAKLKKELSISRLENDKNQTLIHELSNWVQNISEINIGKGNDTFYKINKVYFY